VAADARVGRIGGADSRRGGKGIPSDRDDHDADAETAVHRYAQLDFVDKRATAFARLFQGVQVGAYIGVISADPTATVAANPHLKLIFGSSAETAAAEVGRFARDRLVDQRAREALVERLIPDVSVVNYLPRLWPPDRRVIGVDLPGRAEAERTRREFRIE